MTTLAPTHPPLTPAMEAYALARVPTVPAIRFAPHTAIARWDGLTHRLTLDIALDHGWAFVREWGGPAWIVPGTDPAEVVARYSTGEGLVLVAGA